LPLEKLNNEKTFFILSMDFSHGKTSEETYKMDEISADVIANFRYTYVWDLDIDCRVGLYLILSLVEKNMDVFLAAIQIPQR